ncbi:hypothetical protein Lesp02_12330 [Lentzea sp. NBRC 105346]|nr:hypothetical protein Lesp02_12330 [Lentzea sp. NBRC 105346]
MLAFPAPASVVGLASLHTAERVSVIDGPVVVQQPPWRELVPAAAAVPVSAVVTGGIPQTALQAYRDASGKACLINWSVLAAIGRVESNHGRFGGARLHTDGSTQPVIRGIQLDGRPGVATIRDSDGGTLDGDPVFDRAVGPMQFIPSTWRRWGADGNGDRKTDPDNIFDAALASARYLCAGGDLRDDAAAARAVHRYNHSDEYVRLVMAIATAYRTGTVPVLPDAKPTSAPPSTVAAQAGVTSSAPPPSAGPSSSGATSSKPSSSAKPRPTWTMPTMPTMPQRVPRPSVTSTTPPQSG